MEFKITVERHRPSVTQGMASVLINGVKVMDFVDTIEMVKPGEKYYGENFGGWASKTPDSNFVIGMLFHPHDDIYKNSEKAKKVFEKLREKEEQEPNKNIKKVKYICLDDWGREVFMDENGKLWKYTEPGKMPRERHDTLYDSTENDVYGEPGFPLKSEIDYEIVEVF